MIKSNISFIILVLALVTLFPSQISANAGPTYWQGYPAAEILVIDEGCPIEVISEDLLFDLNAEDPHSYRLAGQVTASYEMINPTTDDLPVQMAFPFIASIADLHLEDISITAGESILPYHLYIGDTVVVGSNDFEQIDGQSLIFSNLLPTIKNATYPARHFSEHEKGKLYTISITPTTEQRVFIATDLAWDPTKTKIIVDGFNGYRWTAGEARVSATCYQPTELSLYVLGDDIDFHVNGYADAELTTKTELFDHRVVSTNITPRQFIGEYVIRHEAAQNRLNNEEGSLPNIAEDQLYNVYASALDQVFSTNHGFCSSDDLFAQSHLDRIMTLVYTANFPANGRQDITVRYVITGTFDRRKTPTPVYTFHYLLNPASNWRHFKDLTIDILTPDIAPYVVDSTIGLEQLRQRHYRLRLNALPENDFVFSVYARKKISWWDSLYKPSKLIPLTVALGLVLLSVLHILKRRFKQSAT